MPGRFLVPFLILAFGAFSSGAFGQQQPMGDSIEQNAALAYWQAFATMPNLTDEEKELFGPIQEGKRAFNEKDKEILARADIALSYLHRGAKIERAAWGVAWDEVPFAILPYRSKAALPHMRKGQDLFQLAELRARLRFEEGRPKEAIDDLIAAMRMARHLSGDRVTVLMPFLVSYAIDTVCMLTIAEHLPEMDAETRAYLKRHLAELPPSRGLADAIHGDKTVCLHWLMEQLKKPDAKSRVLELVGDVSKAEIEAFQELDESELLPAARRLGQYYDRIIADVKLPPGQVEARYKRLLQDIKNNGDKDLLSRWLLPVNVNGLRGAEAAHKTRFALLEAAIAVLDKAPNTLKDPEHQDPFGEGPFTYQETDGGFVLTSDWEFPPGTEIKVSQAFGKK